MPIMPPSFIKKKMASTSAPAADPNAASESESESESSEPGVEDIDPAAAHDSESPSNAPQMKGGKPNPLKLWAKTKA